MNDIPILIFAYNRPEVLKCTIKSLFENFGFEQHPIIIYCDGPKINAKDEDKKNIANIQEIIKSFNWPNLPTIIIQKENLGLAKSIVNGVTETLKIFEQVIVLEDDIQTSPYFLDFMTKSLIFYKDHPDVISITGFNYPLDNNSIPDETFFLKGTECWSWATWRKGWYYFEIDGQKLYNKLKKRKLFYYFDFKGSYNFSGMLKKTIKINHSWAVKWYASAYLADKYTLYPKYSLVENIGEQGTNQSQNHRKMLGKIEQLKPISNFNKNVVQSDLAYNSIARHFKIYNNIIYRIYNFLIEKIVNV